MTRNIMMLALIFTFCLSIFSCSDDDNRRRQRRSPEEQAKVLQEELDLTEAQTKQVEQIYLDSREEMAKVRENFDGDRGQMREVMREYREKINERIEEILNDEQKAKYNEYMEEQRERMRERMRDR